MLIAAFVVGVLVGGLAVWAVLRERLAAQRRAAGELETTFKALSAEALRSSTASLLELATSQLDAREKAVEQLVKPIRESLDRVGNEVRSLERVRRQDYGTLAEQLRSLAETHERLRAETGSLATALRAPAVRGRWGEMQLRRAVEAAGMLAHCDFVEQLSTAAEDGSLRPDLVVRLPGGRSVVVDAKTPLTALIEAQEAEGEDARAERLQAFVRHVREHMAKLSQKAYWQQFDAAPDFVLMFLPGESFFRVALEQDPTLLEHGMALRVIPASPAILVTQLRTVAAAWREEAVAENARAVGTLGRELYERLSVMTEHFLKLGTNLDRAVASYNQAVGSFERRVLVSARRFTELGVGSDRELPEPVAVDHAAQPPQTIELPRPAPPVDADAA